jgi:hypothetical protein
MLQITSIIQPEHELKIILHNDAITRKIIGEVSKIANLTTSININLIKYIASLIENLVTEKIDKKQMFLNVLNSCFQMTEQEIITATQILETLLKINQIKKIPVYKYAIHLTAEFFAFLKKV